ncbi:sensor histidine kinase [Metabacillus niabensis]|uniref:Two-component system sensor histidine kinase YesM n=1 Tax=Metabacillus niabensis TaxID=324854 RepID=A0ABT9Z0U3_9BACI|nr:sensor histidine kinase [Metabacillus niabensis]MDQ0225645.1 two-component system sensor histidine kinase YesM [Metabacillus niabensis]
MWKRINQRLSPRSFRFKLIIASVICIVLPAMITLSVNSYLSKDAMKEQAISNASRELKLAGEYVTKLLDDMLYIANFIQIDSELNTILKNNAKEPASHAEDVLPSEEYEKYIEYSRVVKTIENITLVGEKSYVTILLKNGKHYTNYSISEYNPKEFFEEPWFEQLDHVYGYEAVWIGSQPTVFTSEKETNPYQISVARTLRDSNLKIYGYVIVTIMENKLNQVFENLPGNEEMMLLNGDSQILSHANSEKIGQSFPYIEQMQDKHFSNIIKIGSHDYLIADHQVTNTGWKLVSLTPYMQAINKINSIFNKMFLVQLISFIVFFLLLTYLLQTITKPLVRLGNVVAAVQEGNLKIRTKINSNDEIGRLSASFDQMLERINKMITEITETQVRKRKAEFAMLQAQINPHFLFNVLNSIRMKVMRKGDQESAEMISSLSKLLRMTIDQEKEMILFKEEVEIVKDYINLMNMRQKEKVQFDVSITAEANVEKIPRFILQPIIENSIIHGLNQRAGLISLNSYIANNDFFIVLEDNGQGMDEKTLADVREKMTHREEIGPHKNKQGFSSIGLSNVYERMRMTFGEAFHMEVNSSNGGGTIIMMYVSRGGKRPNV